MKKYRFLDHTADVKFQAFGATLEELFTNAALAMASLMCKEKISARSSVRVHVEGRDLENLLYNFLEEFLVLFDSRSFLLAKVETIAIDDRELRLDAEAVGDLAGNYEIYLGIKAVTYSDMVVREENNTWLAQVVLDV
ncbi:MAG: archease [Candidatus Neomarinimicrobiota bacterium]